MATFDQLSPEKRAIVELVLQQGKRYPELAEMLGMPEPRVRELARDALVELAPVSVRGVEQDWRGQLADYVLGQQSGPEATATKGHLRRSEAARSWTRSLLDSLEQLYPDGSVPAIPDGERGGRRAAAAAPAAARPARERTAGRLASGGPVMRRRLLAGAAAAALVLLALLVWPVGLLTGDDDGGDESAEPAAQNGGSSNIAVETRGQAIIAQQAAGKPQIFVTATQLEPSGSRSAYQVWLYNSEKDRKALGVQATDSQGNLQAGTTLPSDYRNYKFIDVTNVTAEGQNLKTGESVLRGLLQLADKPVTRGKGKNRVTVFGQIELLPLPTGR
jgi:hypothetical protein